MSERRTVLITGVTGRIGRVIIPQLAALDRFELRCGHRRETLEGFPNPVTCRIDDYASVLAAVRGVDTVVHLAADSGDRDYVESMVPHNLVAPQFLCEAALESGVRRIVFASTNHVVLNHIKHGQPAPEDAPYRPDNLYGVTKAYAEVMGRFYVECRGLPSFVSLRIGWFLPDDSMHLRRHWQAIQMWLSPRDCVDLIVKAVEAPDEIGFAVFNAVSDNTRTMLPITAAKERLGYAPQDDSERFVPEFEGELPDFLVPRR